MAWREQRPEPGVEYGAFPTEEYRAHVSLEATRSLAKFLGVTEMRAVDLLADPDAYAVEVRAARGECECGCGLSRAEADALPPVTLSGREAMRMLERKYAAPWMPQ